VRHSMACKITMPVPYPGTAFLPDGRLQRKTLRQSKEAATNGWATVMAIGVLTSARRRKTPLCRQNTATVGWATVTASGMFLPGGWAAAKHTLPYTQNSATAGWAAVTASRFCRHWTEFDHTLCWIVLSYRDSKWRPRETFHGLQITMTFPMEGRLRRTTFRPT